MGRTLRHGHKIRPTVIGDALSGIASKEERAESFIYLVPDGMMSQTTALGGSFPVCRHAISGG